MVTYTFEISVPVLGLAIKPDSTELESFADTKAEIIYNTDKVTASDNLTLEYSLNDDTVLAIGGIHDRISFSICGKYSFYSINMASPKEKNRYRSFTASS